MRLAAVMFLALAAGEPALAQFEIRQIPDRWTGPPPAANAASASGDPLAGDANADVPRPMAGALTTQPPHPAVARITVPEKDGVSLGSGTLVDARGKFGLVITNWHVVREAAGPITVEFPGGHKSQAEVIRTDADWDLAALSIFRPQAEPLAISPQAPQIGEWLAIAGYGNGEYRSAAGVVRAYNSPSIDLPPEFLELSAEARHGDSGGPILNQRGELCGVLFGSAPGYTCGAYGGRVLQFLASVIPGGEPGSDTPAAAGLAGQSTPPPVSPPGASQPPDPAWTARADIGPPRNYIPATPPPQATALHQPPPAAPYLLRPGGVSDPGLLTPAQSLATAGSPLEEHLERPTRVHNPVPPRAGVEKVSAANVNDAPPEQLLAAVWQRFGGTTLYDQARSILALLGVLAVVTQAWRFSSRHQPEGE